MKALSIRQPWAWLVVDGYKPLENRTWTTKYRGEFLVHAGKSYDLAAHQYVRNEVGTLLADELDLHRVNLGRGGFIGIAEIEDCFNPDHPRLEQGHMRPEWERWYNEGCCAWIIKNPRPIEFIPYSGKLGLFNVTDISPADIKEL